MKTKNICKRCKHYQASIVAKYGADNIDGALPCIVCADLKRRKSFFVADKKGFTSDTPAYRQGALIGI